MVSNTSFGTLPSINAQRATKRAPGSDHLIFGQEARTVALGDNADFDQVYNTRAILDKRTFNNRLSRQRSQNLNHSSSSENTSYALIDSEAALLYQQEVVDQQASDSDESTSSSLLVTTGKVPLKSGMLFWIATHKGCYFWVRSCFQLVAFSLLIVTLVMLDQFQSPYWKLTVYLLVAIHSTDFVSFSLDLISFATRNVKLLKYKIGLDMVSFCLSLCMQSQFGRSMSEETDLQQERLGQESYTNFQKMRQWLCLEVALSYLAVLSQIIFFSYVYCTINTQRFQQKYHQSRMAAQLITSSNSASTGNNSATKYNNFSGQKNKNQTSSTLGSTLL